MILRLTLRGCIGLLVLVLATGCATLPLNAGQDPRDPWEKVNRNVFAFNDGFDAAITKPLAELYVKLPEGIRICLSNAFSNLRGPSTAINNFFQSKPVESLSDVGRCGDPGAGADHPRGQDHRGHAGRRPAHRRTHQYRDLRGQLQRPGRNCPQALKEIIAQVPHVKDVRDDFKEGTPSVQVVIDRQKAAFFGLTTDMIGFALKTAYNGLDVSSYREGDEAYDITVQLGEADRKVVDVLDQLMIPAPSGEQVPLSALATVRFAGSLGDITRSTTSGW